MSNLRYYNDHTRYLTDKQLKELERRVNEVDAEFAKKNNGQGDYETILNRISREMRWT